MVACANEIQPGRRSSNRLLSLNTLHLGKNHLYAGTAVIVMTLLLATFTMLYYLHQETEARAIEHTQSLAKSVDQTISGMIDSIDLAMLVSSEEVTRQLGEGSSDKLAITRFLKRQQERLHFLDLLRATNLNGDVIYGEGVITPPANNSDREYFKRLRDNPQAGMIMAEPVIGKISKKWLWLMSRRINHPDGRFAGVIYASMYIDQITRLFEQLKLSPNSSITLRDRDMALITRTTFKDAPPLLIGDKQISTLLRNALSINPQQGTYFSGNASPDRVNRIYSYRHSDKYGYIILVGIPADTVFAEWRQLALTLSSLVTAFIALLLVLLRLTLRTWERREFYTASLEASKEKYSTLLETTATGYLILDNQGRVVDANQEYVRLTGNHELTEILGKSVIEWTAPYHLEKHALAVDQCIRDGYIKDLMIDYKDRSGPTFPVEINAKVLGAGDSQQILSLCRDISERRQNELDLRAANERLSLAQHESLSGVWDWFINTETLVWSSELCELLGVDKTLTTVPFDVWRKLVHPEDLVEAENRISYAIRDGQPLNSQYRIVLPSGQIRWIAAKGGTTYNAQGEPIRMTGICIDITELKALEAERIRVQQAAESANRAKSLFLANMSHEIRSPMNVIIGFTHSLRKNLATPSKRNKLDKISAAAEHLLGVINNILDISKIEADKLVLDNSEFEMESVLSRLIDMVIGRVREKGLELIIDADDDLSAVTGDYTRLCQALLNYLGNAIKFTERGSIILRVRLIEETASELLVRFEVEDSGIGLNAEQISRLFQSFVQAEHTTSKHYGGTGLGLVITRRLAELMGGATGVFSTPGFGSTFWMTARLGRARVEKQRYHLPQYAGLRGLVVDDDPMIRLLHTRLLDRAGIHSASVACGREALASILQADQEGKPFNLILLDLLMPEMDGFQSLQELQALPLKHKPVIWMVTATPDPDIQEKALLAGFNDVVLKPMHQGILYAALLRNQDLILGKIATVTVAETPVKEVSKIDEILKTQYPNTRILLVEDDLFNQEVALMHLGDLGWEPDVANNGREAVEYATANDYDLILMDMKMPVMDGLQATRLIRQIPGRGEVLIIAMTANAFNEERDACLAAGMNDFISKPVILSVLHEKLLSYLASGKP